MAQSGAQSDAYVDIEKFEENRFLGNGSFGDVYLYTLKQGEVPDSSGIIQMAVKQLHAEGEDRENVRKEIKIMVERKHENIVKYLGEHDKGPHHIQIMMEFMPGGSVGDKLKDQAPAPFTEERTKRYTRDVLKGLEYLHENRTLHRDIKGDNILLDGEDRAKLADFGLAKILETNKSRTRTCVGTALFMSPEIVKGGVDGHSYKTDIWSIGCVVVQMLSSKPPWMALCERGEIVTEFQLMTAITECDHPKYDLPNDVSKVARDFINKCFAIKPDDRPTAENLLRHQFLA